MTYALSLSLVHNPPLGLDKGGADLIASGDIKVKQGTEPTAYTSNGLLFSDSSELPADAVIFA